MSDRQYRALVGRDRLEAFGPLIDVSFGVVLYVPNAEPDDRITQPMLLDTGAQLTLVEEVLPQQLGIEPHRYRSILGIGGPMRCPVYMMSLSIALSPSGALVFWQEVVAVPPAHEGRRHVGLLGRDAMRTMYLTYDGARGEYIVAPNFVHDDHSDSSST